MRAGCIDESLDLRARTFERIGGFAGESIRTAIDRGVTVAHEVRHRVDDTVGLLRRVGRIEVDQTLAVDATLQHGKVGLDGGPVHGMTHGRNDSYPETSSFSAISIPPLATMRPSTMT